MTEHRPTRRLGWLREKLHRWNGCRYMDGSSLSMSSRYLTHCRVCGRPAPEEIVRLAEMDEAHIQEMRAKGRRARIDKG